MNKIIDLQETSPNFWKAKYQGNYGTYIIKVETDGKSLGVFSCTCSSDYYPCEHIRIVREAIGERMDSSKKGRGKGLFEDVVEKITEPDLREFVIRYGLHNASFQQAVMVEFTPGQESETSSNSYLEIIRCALENIYFDSDDIYDYQYECFEISALDQWLDKAGEYIAQGNYPEAILIAKACIEAYAEWINTIDCDVEDYTREDYAYEPFRLFDKAYNNGYLTAENLLEYCQTEVVKEKYEKTSIKASFNDLIMNLTEVTDPEAFIAMQDRLLLELDDKTSYKAEGILKRKINFYKKRGEYEAAQKIAVENIQIESFRKEVLKNWIVEGRLKEAKALVDEYIRTKEHDRFYAGGYNSCWDEYLLEIARLEGDSTEIRRITRKLVDRSFQPAYYRIYKSTFQVNKWVAEMEELIQHYEKMDSRFSTNVADLLVEERKTDRLLTYITQHLHVEKVGLYYRYLTPEFPEKTLALFKRAMDEYLKNTGKEIYENATRYFGSMLEIEGGKKMVNQMIEEYRVLYKNRKAMIEVFERFGKSHLPVHTNSRERI